MQYILQSFTVYEVEAEISIFTVPGKMPEYHMMLHGCNPLLSYELQLSNLLKAYDELLASGIWVRKPVSVFNRYFLSDAANQTPELQRAIEHYLPVAVSIVQQPPMDGTKIALWSYLLSDVIVESHKISNLLQIKRPSYIHCLTASRGVASGNSENQTRELLETYEEDLKQLGCTISEHCLRTWFFVQNVDVNYSGVVKARRENFIANWLTNQTHYIASTGIEGRSADPSVHVLLDAYSVAGIRPEQISYLYAYSHLSPTHVYGVTFERGVSIQYGDRRQLYISGTASIDNKGMVVHTGDVVAQTRRMWENVAVLLKEGGGTFEDLNHMIVYLRDASDYLVVRPMFDEQFKSVPKIFVLAPVCRPAWLIEMECMATLSNTDSRFEDF